MISELQTKEIEGETWILVSPHRIKVGTQSSLQTVTLNTHLEVIG